MPLEFDSFYIKTGYYSFNNDNLPLIKKHIAAYSINDESNKLCSNSNCKNNLINQTANYNYKNSCNGPNCIGVSNKNSCINFNTNYNPNYCNNNNNDTNNSSFYNKNNISSSRGIWTP